MHTQTHALTYTYISLIFLSLKFSSLGLNAFSLELCCMHNEINVFPESTCLDSRVNFHVMIMGKLFTKSV